MDGGRRYDDPAITATWTAWGKNVVVQRMAVVTLCSLGFLAALSNSMLVYKVFRSKPLAAGGWLAHVGIGHSDDRRHRLQHLRAQRQLHADGGRRPQEAFGYQFTYERMTGKPIPGRPLNPDYDRAQRGQLSA